MEYVLGNSKYLRSRGETIEITCPSCSNEVKFGVFSNFKTEIIPNLPLVDFNTVYFLVCPSCASIYAIDEEIGKQLKKDNSIKISADDLKPLKALNKEAGNE